MKQGDIPTLVEELRELLAKATPGPWCLSGGRSKNDIRLGDHTSTHGVGPDGDAVAVVFHDDKTGRGYIDGKLIAAAVNALPALLDALSQRKDAVGGGEREGHTLDASGLICSCHARFSTRWEAAEHATGTMTGPPAYTPKAASSYDGDARERLIQTLKEIDDGRYASLNDRADAILAALPTSDASERLREVVKRADAALPDGKGWLAVSLDKNNACIELADWRSYLPALLDGISPRAIADREQGPPCPNCGKAVEVGQVVLPWEDAGEMHVDCEHPFALKYEPGKDEPKPVVLLGQPMQYFPLAALSNNEVSDAK